MLSKYFLGLWCQTVIERQPLPIPIILSHCSKPVKVKAFPVPLISTLTTSLSFALRISRVLDQTCVGLDAFQIGHVKDRMRSGSDVFWIGRVPDWSPSGLDWESPKMRRCSDRTHRALKTRRCSGSDWESPKNKEMFWIRLRQP